MTAERDPLLEAVDLLAPALNESGLEEIEVEAGGLGVRLARPRALPPQIASQGVATPSAPAPAPAQAPAPAAAPFGQPASGMRHVSAPLTGVWYAAPSPEARPYVQVGSELVSGQVIGLIEAMKLFNEIKSDVSGVVKRILVENGTLVKRRQPILEIDPG